jgi:hypothetical protein
VIDPNLDGSENSLEDGHNLTAHFIGLSGEQDVHGLSCIRYNILNETSLFDFNVRQVFAGDIQKGTPHAHFAVIHDSFSDRDQRVKNASSDAIESHIRGHGDALVRLYFRFVHPLFPILSKSRFIKSYTEDKLSIPASLRGAVYGLACTFGVSMRLSSTLHQLGKPIYLNMLILL